MRPTHDKPWSSLWEVLNAHAWWRLNHSGQLAPCVGQSKSFRESPRLRIWDDAMGFGCDREPMTLVVFETFAEAGETDAIVREAVWERTADLRCLCEGMEMSGGPVLFEPTVKVRDGDVPIAPFLGLLKEATSFRVPTVWLDDVEAVTTDVGAVGIDCFSGDQPPTVLRLQWSDGKPRIWGPIAEWFSRLRAFLVSCLPEEARSVEQRAPADRPRE
jgi:hypothetical protein